MTGLWMDTINRCQEKLKAAHALLPDGVAQHRIMVQEVMEETEVVRAWVRMTRLLREVER